jgi:hypothetical protein
MEVERLFKSGGAGKVPQLTDQSTTIAGNKPRLLPRLLGPVRMREQLSRIIS